MASPPNALSISNSVAPASVAGATVPELTILIIGCRYLRESRMPSPEEGGRGSVVATALRRHFCCSHAAMSPCSGQPRPRSASTQLAT